MLGNETVTDISFCIRDLLLPSRLKHIRKSSLSDSDLICMFDRQLSSHGCCRCLQLFMYDI